MLRAAGPISNRPRSCAAITAPRREIVLNVMQPVWASGRIETVLSWTEWLEGRSEVEQYPGFARTPG